MDIAAELYEIARHHGGLITTAQSEAIGIAHQRLTDLARNGTVARIANGVYAFGAAINRLDPRAVTQAHRVVLSHMSATAWHNVELVTPPRSVWVTAPRNRGRRRNSIPGITLNRYDLAAHEVIEIAGVRVTTPLRTAIDVARELPLAEAVAAVDSFLRHKLVTADEFGAAAAAWRGPGRTRLLLVTRLIDPDAGSVLESITRVLMWQHDLPVPKSQLRFSHPRTGYVGRFDFGWEEFKALLESDGYEYHADRGPIQKDRRRWSAVGTTDWKLGLEYLAFQHTISA